MPPGSAGINVRKTARYAAKDRDPLQQSAGATVLGKPLPRELRYYSLKRGDESGIVLTYPDVLERIWAEGWTLVASAWTLPELDR